jgi:hypothetical protein
MGVSLATTLVLSMVRVLRSVSGNARTEYDPRDEF